LERDRLVGGTIDLGALTRIQAHPKPRCGLCINVVCIPYHRLYGAGATARSKRRDKLLIAEGRKNWLVRSDRPQILDSIVGTGGGASSGEGEHCACSCHFQELACHREISFAWLLKLFLSMEGILDLPLVRRCGNCHTAECVEQAADQELLAEAAIWAITGPDREQKVANLDKGLAKTPRKSLKQGA
jgi:hypothetical protein